MRVCMFRPADREEVCVGEINGEEVILFEQGQRSRQFLRDLISGKKYLTDKIQQARVRNEIFPVQKVKFCPPVADDQAVVICVGKNYRAHAKEFFGSGFDSSAAEETPAHPVVFAKAGSSLVGHDATINSHLDETGTVDYEGELAVIIGKPAHKVARADAMEHVFGYSIINDVTARELQKRHSQWLIGKSLDTFGPYGPCIVTRDEIPEIEEQMLETRVNGELRQRASISDMIFDIPCLIETLSRTMTLRPGDIIATGTPAGVGIGFMPPKYLKPGDIVEVTITKIGLLRNKVG